MSPKQTQTERLLQFIREEGLIRSRELARLAIRRQTLARACQHGLVERCSRGTYRLSGVSQDEHSCLAAACKRIPRGVVCLTSALWFHGLLCGQPKQVWIAVNRKARLPRVDKLAVKVVRFSGEAMTQGIVNLKLNGTFVRVYSPMKTVADCFKYRNKLGSHLGTTGLRAATEQNKYNRQKLLHFAEICRVKKIVIEAADEVESAIKIDAQQRRMETPRVWHADMLRQQVWAEPLRLVARRYGVSDVALAKRCRKLGIPLPGRGYWAKAARQD